MKHWHKFRHLPSAEQRLLMMAALLLGMIRLSLRLLPFPTFRRLLTTLKQVPICPSKARRFPSDRIVWAVAAVTRYIPGGTTCLTQALTVRVLLEWQGYPAQLQIGVTRAAEGHFQAHAWVETQGKILMGNRADLSSYAMLSSFDGERL